MSNRIDRNERRDDLFQYAAGKPDGFTYRDAMDDLGWEYAEFHRAVHDLRIWAGDWDDVFLIVEPSGWQQWRYRLVGNLENAQQWMKIRTADMTTRIGTMRAGAATLVRSSDGRSSEGRRARILHRGLTRIVEDLADLTE